MAAVSTYLLAAALIMGATATYQGYQARKEQAAFNRQSALENKKARNEERAQNYQQMAAERRSQVREERVRRARILQGAENSGSSGSSGEAGAIGGMATQLQANIGMNLGRAQSGNLISGYLQNAADFNTSAQQSGYKAQNADALFSLSQSIFGAAGGGAGVGAAYKRNFG